MREINISTMVGCPIRCNYCPQKLVQSRYRSVRLLTFDNFVKMLTNINTGIQINFAGVAENFYNPELINMIVYASLKKYSIGLYTTLENVTDDDVTFLAENNVEFEIIYFHRFENYNEDRFNHYVDLFRNNLQIKSIIDLPITNPFSRASNLNGFDIEKKYGSLQCDFWGKNMIFYENTVMPNGDIYICCMDFGLKHKIGNLFEFNYESDIFNAERNRLNNMLINNEDIICRRCEFSVEK